MVASVRLGRYFLSGLRRVFSGMMLSRVSGLGRDLSMAYAFGDHPMVAAFIVAFRLANLLRRFFGEGPLQSAFIPQFEGMKKENREEAYAFFRKLTVCVGGLVLLIIGIGELGIHASMGLWSGKNQEILVLMKWMLPTLFFISLYGLNVSFLQCHSRFFVSSMAPFLCNAMWIMGALTLKNLPMERAMLGLAKMVLVGFIIQWMATAFQMLKVMGTKKWLTRPLFPKEVKTLAKAFSLGAFGVGAMQINSFLDTIFSRCAHISGPVYLWYASRFQQLALAIFGIAAVSTLIPLLSRAIKGKEIERARGIFSFGCKKVALLMVPMTFAIGALGFSAIDLVLGRGSFTSYATTQTAQCLIVYGLSLLPSTLVMIDSAVFYAEGDFKTPAYFSLMTVGINGALNTLFVFGLGLGPVSIALATSASAWCNFIGLRRLAQKKGWRGSFAWKEWILLLGGATLAGAASMTVQSYFVDKLLRFTISGTAFVGTFGAFLFFFWKRFFDDRAAETGLLVVEDH